MSPIPPNNDGVEETTFQVPLYWVGETMMTAGYAVAVERLKASFPCTPVTNPLLLLMSVEMVSVTKMLKMNSEAVEWMAEDKILSVVTLFVVNIIRSSST
jgi:hypothetical protein